MVETVYVSEAGLKALKQRLAKAQTDLKTIRDEKSVAYTATGDTWHDNPYFNKLEQDERNKEGEVAELNGLVAVARIYSANQRNTARVALGSIVHLSRYFKVTSQDDEQVWEVVGYGEIDVPKQKVPYNSPLMQAIMGLHVGETANSVSPQGPVEYEVLALFASWDDVPASLKTS